MEDVSMSFSGTFGAIENLKKYTARLSNDFDLKYLVHDRFSSATGSTTDPIDPFWSVNLRIKSDFIAYVKGYLLSKGADYVLNKLFMKPFFEWMEKNQKRDDFDNPKEIKFQYDDVTITVAYVQDNHQNVVSRISGLLAQKLASFNRLDLGTVNRVASPVINVHGEWHHMAPKNNMWEISGFWEHLGLEYNTRNRCVYESNSKEVIFEHWW